MSYNEDQLWDLLRQAYDMPYGGAQIALVEQIMAHADAQHLDELAFETRMLATTSYVYGGEPVKSFVTFSWCLAEFDANPAAHSRRQHTLMWQFKYMVSGLTKFPEVPLERTYEVLDDMERRWRDGGHSLHAVYSHRHLVARHLGDLETAAHWYGKWCTAPRDNLSDCVGCDPSSKAAWLSTVHRDEEAVALAEPVLSGRLTCSEQPQGILTGLLKPYLRTGRLEQARDAHRRAYRLHRPNLADLGDIANHLEFCARTGNEVRGLEILERHLGWLDKAPSPFSAMWFAAAAALVLNRVQASGGSSVTVHRPAHRDRPAADLDLAALAAELTGFALATASRFDTRNGTDYQTREIHELLAAGPLVEQLPLAPAPGGYGARLPDLSAVDGAVDGAAGGAAAAVGVAAANGAAGNGAAGNGSAGNGSAPVGALVVPPTADPDELLDLAERRWLDDQPAVAVAAWQAFDARYGALALTVRQQARRAEGEGFARAHARDLKGQEAAWRQAVELYAEEGDELARQRALARLGQALCAAGDPEGLAVLEPATEYLVTHDTDDRSCDDLLRLAAGYDALGRLEEALATVERAEAHVGSSRRPLAEADLVATRAGALNGLDRADEARECAERAVALIRASGSPTGLARALFLLAACAHHDGDIVAAVDACDEALDLVTPAGGAGRAGPDPELAKRIRSMRAMLLSATPRAAEAIDDLAEIVASGTAQGQEEWTARARHQLALAYLNADRPLDAAEVAEEALLWHAAHADDNLNSVRHLLSDAYQRLGQPGEALTQLELILADCDGRGNRAGVGQMAEEIGSILDGQDRDAAAATRFLEAASAYREAGLPFEEVRSRRRHASSLLWSEHLADAVAALAVADECAAALPDEPQSVWERAWLDSDAAKILLHQSTFDPGRLADATARAQASVDGFLTLGASVPAARAYGLLGELLMRQGRPAEAERVIRTALTDLPEDARPEWLTRVLADALDALGRPAEARDLRASIEPPEEEA